jgi:hypothetical protein
MKKIKINGAKLQLHKQQIVALNAVNAGHVQGGAATTTSEITPSGPIVLSPNCPVNPGTAWCPISDPPPSRPGG